jgi:hypothetical protein
VLFTLLIFVEPTTTPDVSIRIFYRAELPPEGRSVIYTTHF